ncbi:PABP-interacting PAM2 motif-containing protein, partial [Chlamydia pecorum]|uniref:PABP-interacting PAM2 motif-containing protein n=1 Tax=Chlamydia pecorum TaxID=85991 RepID=UPI001E4FB9AC
MSIPPVYPCPYCGYNFMLCAHGPNALAVGISRLSLETIECSKKTSNLNPSAKEFIPRFTMSHPY